MDEEESGSEVEVTKTAKTRRKRGKAAANVSFRRKFSRKSSSSASEAVDSNAETPFCNKSVHEVHMCSETDAFSETDNWTESTSTFAVDSETSESGKVKMVKRLRKRKRFLSHKKSHSAKTVGNLQIVSRDGDDNGDTGGSSESSDESSDEDLDFSGLDETALEGLLKVCADIEANQSKTQEEHAANNPDTGDSTQDSDQQASADLETTILSLQDNFKLLLSNVWCVNTEEHVIRLIKISTKKNAQVDFSIFYDAKEKAIGIFVHGVPVSPENRVFKCHNVPDTDNIGSLADYLAELTKRVEVMKVCKGISEHEDLWNMSKGFLDYSTPSSPHYRSGSCHLLIKQNVEICQSCQEEFRRLEREEKRRENPTDSTPDKYLSSDSMKEKKDKYRKLYRAEKQKTTRLEKKLTKVKIKLDAALSDELSSLLTVNQHKMTKLQKLFWEQQRRAFSLNDSRGMRWHPMLIRLALHLHSLSDSAYSFLGESKILVLPSKRRLYDYSHFIEPKEGCQEEFLHHIREKISKCGTEDHFSYVNLMFDEMNIRSGLVIKRSTGELIGYTQLNDCEEELKKMQDDIDSKIYKPKLAKKVLVYLANGITSKVKDVVAVYSSDVLSATQLYERTWEVIYNLEDAGIKVHSITCDGASVNRKFLLMNESLDKQIKYTYCSKNLAAGSRPLFFILDPPHLLKTVRNALGNSFSHKKTRKLWKNNEYLSWKVIEELYKLTERDKFRSHKLTKAHIKLTSFSCMTVLYATQVFSNSVASSIEAIAGHERMKMFQTCELVKFIRLMNRFFDCMNGKEETTGEDKEKESEEEAADERREEENVHDKAPYRKLDDPRFDFLQYEFLNYFSEWKNEIDSRPGLFSETEKNRMIISHQSLGALETTVNGIVGAIRFMIAAGAPSVNARVYNQDPLEQYFGKVRRSHGDNRNPSLKAFQDARLNLHAQGLVASSSQKGNTEVQKRKGAIEIDSSELPVRKSSRK